MPLLPSESTQQQQKPAPRAPPIIASPRTDACQRQTMPLLPLPRSTQQQEKPAP